MSLFPSLAGRTLLAARRGGFVLAPLAALLTVGGCSELTGGDGPSQIIEISVSNSTEHIFLTARRGSSSGGIPVEIGVDLPLEVRLFGDNGVKIESPHSVSARVTNPAFASWEPRGDKSFALTGLAEGSTSVRIDVSRGDSVVFTSSQIIVQVTEPNF
jgi:hypothetical protein